MGATSVSNLTRGGELVCVCVQATHWCPRSVGLACGATCAHAGGTPLPHDFCVPDSTPPPPAPPPAGPEARPVGVMTSLLIPPVRRHEPRAPSAIRRTGPSNTQERASCSWRASALKNHRVVPGDAVAAVRGLRSSAEARGRSKIPFVSFSFRFGVFLQASGASYWTSRCTA